MKIGFTSTSFRQIKSIEKIVKIASEFVPNVTITHSTTTPTHILKYIMI